jgi:hypothetical protein
LARGRPRALLCIGDGPAEKQMQWSILVLAGLLEIGWAIGLKYTEGFTRLWPSVLTILAMTVSLGHEVAARRYGLCRLDGHRRGRNGDIRYLPVWRVDKSLALAQRGFNSARRYWPQNHLNLNHRIAEIFSNEMLLAYCVWFWPHLFYTSTKCPSAACKYPRQFLYLNRHLECGL